MTYVTGGLEPLVFLLSTASVWPAGTFIDLRCDICDRVAETHGLPLHLPHSSRQVLYFISSVTCVMGMLGPWTSSLSTTSVCSAVTSFRAGGVMKGSHLLLQFHNFIKV
jgi:hypothetical protein